MVKYQSVWSLGHKPLRVSTWTSSEDCVPGGYISRSPGQPTYSEAVPPCHRRLQPKETARSDATCPDCS